MNFNILFLNGKPNSINNFKQMLQKTNSLHQLQPYHHHHQTAHEKLIDKGERYLQPNEKILIAAQVSFS